MTSQSANSGSENWETYADNSDIEDPEAHKAHYSQIRTTKRETPDGGYDGVNQSDTAKKIRGYGLGIHNAGGVGGGGQRPVAEVYSNGREGSEEGWTDDGSTF